MLSELDGVNSQKALIFLAVIVRIENSSPPNYYILEQCTWGGIQTWESVIEEETWFARPPAILYRRPRFYSNGKEIEIYNTAIFINFVSCFFLFGL
jgi:hypothetical protein